MEGFSLRPVLGAIVLFLAASLLAGCRDERLPPRTRSAGAGAKLDSLEPTSAKPPERPSLGEGHRSHLSPRRSYGDTSSFGHVTELVASGPLLVAADASLPPLLKVVDRESGRVSAFGREGSGPGEFRSPRSLVSLDTDPPTFQLFDFQNQRLTLFRWIREREEVRYLEHRRFVAGIPIEQVVPRPSAGGYVASGPFRAHTLLVADSAGRERRRITTGVPLRVDPPAMREANLRHFAADPGHTRFAVAWQHANRIDLLRGLEGTHRRVKGPRGLNTDYTTIGPDFELGEDGEIGYVDIHATGARVYALYCGCSDSDETEQGISHLPRLVHVFGWNGDYRGEIDLGREVREIAVARDDSLLWGATRGDPIPRIAEWSLPAWVRRAGG